MTDYVRETLPQEIEPYRQEAKTYGKEEFQSHRPYPFLLYVRSRLWDPKILHKEDDDDSQTRMAAYDLHEGGVTFLHPIRKRQTDAGTPGIILGRSVEQDLVVPVPSISGNHITFYPPGDNPLWTVRDMDSRNGTWIGEDKLDPHTPHPIKDRQYLRLGGDLMAWFLYPGRLWTVLRDSDELNKLTDP